MAKELELKLKAGDVAPDFSVASNGGGKVSLADFKGKPVILYFYPKDDTPGCTKGRARSAMGSPNLKSAAPSCSASAPIP